MERPDLHEDAMLHGDGEQQGRLDVVMQQAEELGVVAGVIGPCHGQGGADGRLGPQPTRDASQQLLQSLRLIQPVQRVHTVKERVVADEAPVMRRGRTPRRGRGAAAVETQRTRRRLRVEGQQLTEAFGDVGLVEFDDEVRMVAEPVAEEDEKGDGLFVDEEGAVTR